MMDYNKTREDAMKRKQELLARQEQIQKEKAQRDQEMEQNRLELIGLDQILEGLEFMESGPPPDLEPVGLTDKMKRILQTTNVYLLPTQIRDALMTLGETGSSMKNLLISVHSILERHKRFLVTKEISGKTAYKWNEPVAHVPVHRRHVIPGRIRLGDLIEPPPPSIQVKPPTPVVQPPPPPQVKPALREAMQEWARKMEKEKK